MFRFAELLIVIIMLYLIMNILRFMIVKSSGTDKLRGNWLFGLSDSWIGTNENAKKNGTKKDKQENHGGET